MRYYRHEETTGTPVDIKTAKQRRALIGKVIEWNTHGWIHKNWGRVEAAEGKNMLIEGDWKWAPDMLNVKVREEN